MQMKHIIDTVFFILYFVLKGAYATITQVPSNTVAKIGNQVKLNCVADVEIGYWVLSKNGVPTSALTIVGPGCPAVRSAFVDHYTVEVLGGGTTCNLIVFNITMEQAGVYRCTEDQNTADSLFTVIENSPVITVNSSTTVAVVEKEIVVIECSLKYNGSVPPAPTLQPYFYWTDSTGHDISSSSDSTTNDSSVSQLIVTAARENITSYTCHVYLQLLPPTNTEYASNTPIVSDSASSPTIEVLYGIGPVSVTQNTNQNGVFLICHATGNPTPIYSWTGPDGFINDTQRIIQIYEPGYYVCNATNAIRGKTYSNTGGINITEGAKWKLIVSVIIPWIGVCLIATIIFIVCYASLATPFRAKMLSRFSWLEYMLPCVNNPKVEPQRGDESLESSAHRWKIVGFVILLIFVSVTCGILFFPILITIAYCCPTGEVSDGQTVNRSPKKGKPIYFVPLFVLMWFGVIAFMFPLTLVLVYFLDCKQMTF